METYLSIEGLAKYLDVSEKTIRKWVLKRQIPFHKIMGVIRFRISEVEKWIDDGGYTALMERLDGNIEGDFVEDAMSLDELEALEKANEEPGDEE